MNPIGASTPEKPANPPPRVLTRRQSLRKPDPNRSGPSDPVRSSTIRITEPKASESLPEKYVMLDRFFHSLGSSIRLLRLKGSMSTFTNISRQVERLTDRSFEYGHLGQIKFVLPEVIEIKKILVRDDRTSCMKPDLYVSLNLDVVEDDDDDEEKKMSSDSGYLRLTKLFRARLVAFCRSNPEGEEVPQEKLPDPFNQSGRSANSNIQKPDRELEPDTTYPLYEQQPMAASHMPQSFKRHFPKQVPIQNVETVDKSFQTPVKWSAKLPETPIKGLDVTPVKLVSTPLACVPSAGTFVRCLMTVEKESNESPSKLTRILNSRRAITFDTPVKNKTLPVERVSRHDDGDDDDDILSHDLLASIREKEKKALEEKNPEISQAKRRKQMLARLPKLFDTLLFYFQSTKRTVITKPELVNMIVSSQLEIVDPREVDEQLRLLQELAPEWVYEKIASSGDLLFCANKISSPESIRGRLSEANLEN